MWQNVKDPLSDHLLELVAPAARPDAMLCPDNTIAGSQRDGIVVYGPIGLRIERNTVTRAALSGIHVRAADRGQPVIDVHVVGNTATRNRGPGIFVDLDPVNGAPVFARRIEVTGNRLVGNASKAERTLRAGLVVAGRGELTLGGNSFSRNAGRGLPRLAADADNLVGGVDQRIAAKDTPPVGRERPEIIVDAGGNP